MSPSGDSRPWVGAALLAGLLYVVAGAVTAELARTAGSPGMAKFWRLSAWPLSLAVFLGHTGYERARRAPLPAAFHVALGAALGGLLLAAVGPVRSHWGAPDFTRAALLSLLVWPFLTGIPAFVLGFLAASIGAARRSRSAG